jgi:hypothetical protein
LAMGLRPFRSHPHDEKHSRELLQILLCRVYPSGIGPLSVIQRLSNMLEKDKSYTQGVSLFGKELYDKIDMLRDIRRTVTEKCRELEREQRRLEELKEAHYRALVARVIENKRRIEEGISAADAKMRKLDANRPSQED